MSSKKASSTTTTTTTAMTSLSDDQYDDLVERKGVYPHYSSTAAYVLGTLQIVGAIVSIILGIVSIALKTLFYFYLEPLWAGVALFLVAGILGVKSATQRKKIIIPYMVMCMLSAVVAGFGFMYRMSYAICQSWACHHPRVFSARPVDDPFLVTIINGDPYGFTRNCTTSIIVNGIISTVFFCHFVAAITGSVVACCGGICCNKPQVFVPKSILLSESEAVQNRGRSPVIRGRTSVRVLPPPAYKGLPSKKVSFNCKNGPLIPSEQRAAERTPVDRSPVERRRSVERRPVEQDELERGVAETGVVERRPADRNSRERSLLERNRDVRSTMEGNPVGRNPFARVVMTRSPVRRNLVAARSQSQQCPEKQTPVETNATEENSAERNLSEHSPEIPVELTRTETNPSGETQAGIDFSGQSPVQKSPLEENPKMNNSSELNLPGRSSSEHCLVAQNPMKLSLAETNQMDKNVDQQGPSSSSPKESDSMAFCQAELTLVEARAIAEESVTNQRLVE
ncbi:uncharacterized protein [Diadema antillarum]|uniref:uncharacterized protein n=1 Tax=Diadema antillarum TaxID=105358 RepID=UPI003A8B048D